MLGTRDTRTIPDIIDAKLDNAEDEFDTNDTVKYIRKWWIGNINTRLLGNMTVRIWYLKYFR